MLYGIALTATVWSTFQSLSFIQIIVMKRLICFNHIYYISTYLFNVNAVENHLKFINWPYLVYSKPKLVFWEINYRQPSYPIAMFQPSWKQIKADHVHAQQT